MNKIKPRILSGKRLKLIGFPRILSFILGVFLTIFTFYTAFKGVFQPTIQRSIHICLLLALTFLWYPATQKSSKENPTIIDYILVILSLFILIWTLHSHDRFLMRIWYYSDVPPRDMIVGYSLLILVLEAGRRTLGLTISIITGVFIVYAFLGPYMPMMLAHRGMNITKFVDVIYLTNEGLFNSLMGLSATILFGFIAFGTLLRATNTDKYYMNICIALAGRKAGGPAKVAILSSAAMSTISGSTIANVVTTGTLTIPLMKKTGYPPHEAAAIETAASAAGIITPPVMGSAAFIMAEVLGIRYIDVVKVAFIPAIIYYFTLWFLVDIKATKRKLKGLRKENVPKFINSLIEGLPAFIPIIVLIILLLKNFTPFYAGCTSTLLVLIISLFRKSTRLSIKKFFLTLEQCSINMTSIVGILACAATIVGIISTSGLMMKATSIILHFSGRLLIPTILLEMLIGYILGMGLPISTSYIILSTLGAPALIELGVLPIAAHFMVMYFANLATITPPVCMTAFAAAKIADADPMQTGFSALKFGSAFYLVPILFIFSKIMYGNFLQAGVIAIIAITGIYFLVCGLEGYFFGNLNYIKRITCFIIFISFFVSTFRLFPFHYFSLVLLILGMTGLVGMCFNRKMQKI